MPCDWSRRAALPELMDDPEVPPEELETALGELERINRYLGGHRTSLRGIARFTPPQGSSLSILDVGAGGGDLAVRLARWAVRRKVTLRYLGIDLLEPAVAYARRRAPPGCRFEVADLFTFECEEPFDIVHAALMLHHLDDTRAVEALRAMLRLARRGVVINDLHRRPAAYHAIRFLTRLASRSRLVRYDGPLSVLRGFRREELRRLFDAAGARKVELRRMWAYRWLAVAETGHGLEGGA